MTTDKNVDGSVEKDIVKHAANDTNGITVGMNVPKTTKNCITNGVPSAARPTNTPIPPGAQACIQRPKPEASSSVTPRLVFGYVRMEEPDEAEIARLRDELGRFCLGQRLHLGGVFCDRGVAEDAIARVGFAGALDALRMPESYALLVPSREHLSGLELVERALVRIVNRTGCRVLALPAAAGSTVEVSS